MLLAGFLTACGAGDSPVPANAPKIQVTSPAFTEGRPIPQKQAYDGGDLSPALQWSGIPPDAKSLALVCDDPDAPSGTWVHWVIYNLPASLNGLPEGVPKSEELPDGTRQGMNDFKKIGYDGPYPPPGKAHRYFFKLYALDTAIDLKPGATQKELFEALDGHVIAAGKLMGTCQRQ